MVVQVWDYVSRLVWFWLYGYEALTAGKLAIGFVAWSSVSFLDSRQVVMLLNLVSQVLGWVWNVFVSLMQVLCLDRKWGFRLSEFVSFFSILPSELCLLDYIFSVVYLFVMPYCLSLKPAYCCFISLFLSKSTVKNLIWFLLYFVLKGPWEMMI